MPAAVPPDTRDPSLTQARDDAIEECARWHDDGAINADFAAKMAGMDHQTAHRHREHARQHRYAVEQLRQLKRPPR